MAIVRLMLTAIGGLGVMIGLYWALQGAGMIPGEFIMGATNSLVRGAVAVASGFALVVIAQSMKSETT